MTDIVDFDRDKRQSIRVSILCRMKIIHSSFGEKEVNTRDISDEGLFLLLDSEILPPQGTIVQGQVLGVLDNSPVLDLKIVRCDGAGAGFQFVGEPEQLSKLRRASAN